MSITFCGKTEVACLRRSAGWTSTRGLILMIYSVNSGVEIRKEELVPKPARITRNPWFGAEEGIRRGSFDQAARFVIEPRSISKRPRPATTVIHRRDMARAQHRSMSSEE